MIVPINTFYQRILPAGGRKISVNPKPNTIIKIDRVDEEPECSVCEYRGSSQVCNPKQLDLEDPATNVSVEFTCPQPQDFFTVEINRKIGITDFITCENLKICLFQLKSAAKTKNPPSTFQTAKKPPVQEKLLGLNPRSSPTSIGLSSGI